MPLLRIKQHIGSKEIDVANYTKKREESINPRNFTDNKTIKLFLTDKGTTSRKITLIESGEILTEDVKVAEPLNCFFSEAPKKLHITENQYLLYNTDELNEPVESLIYIAASCK